MINYKFYSKEQEDVWKDIVEEKQNTFTMQYETSVNVMWTEVLEEEKYVDVVLHIMTIKKSGLTTVKIVVLERKLIK